MREGGSCASARPLGENSRPDSNIDAVRASVSDLDFPGVSLLVSFRSLTLPVLQKFRCAYRNSYLSSLSHYHFSLSSEKASRSPSLNYGWP
jgi:hypothetical protein